MPGTLLAYDAAFPRPADTSRTGPIVNRPSASELAAYSELYPGPYTVLPIQADARAETYVRQIAATAGTKRPLDRLILFGHGRVARTRNGMVTTGIIIGANDITSDNAYLLQALRPHFSEHAMAELWVCNAAAAGESAGVSGRRLCTAIAAALGVTVKAGEDEQEYTSVNQREIPTGGWDSEVRFLPWEGRTVHFLPSGATMRIGTPVIRR